MAKKKDTDAAPDSATGVFVALNHPQGIIFTLPNNRKVTISGNAEHLRGKEKGVLPVGGFGLTRIEASEWEYIQAEYGHMAIFKHGLIFAHSRKAKARDEAEEKVETRHGRESVDTTATKTEEVRRADLV
jgi:hypothetical protein